MQALEHAMLGGGLVLAAGLHRRFGWQLAASAAVCATLPDWDGLTVLFDFSLFDRAHRAWGHGILPCLTVAFCWAALDYRFDLVGRLARLFFRLVRVDIPPAVCQPRTAQGRGAFFVWLAILAVAALSHPLVDMVFSGAEGLSDWAIQFLWPFSSRGFVRPLVPWGDVGVLVIFFLGVFAMIRWRDRVQTISLATLLSAATYAVARGMI